MNILQPHKNQKNRGQAMMEFALVIPILLLLLYGVLETGRLLFIYASTITAARQAVRYGSATGDNPDGILYYNDCDGIVDAANKVAFINTFKDVTISYDGGLDSANGNPESLTPDPECGSFTTVKNGDRIIVSVSADWQPIVPIVPLEPFTITSQSERTILAAVSIYVDGESPDFGSSGFGELVLSVSPVTGTYDNAGDIIEFTFTLTNDTDATDVLDAPFSVTTTINGNAVTITCTTGAPVSLAIGASFTCVETYSYMVTQDDMDAGSFVSSSIGDANGSLSNIVTGTFTAIQLPELSLSIIPNPKVASEGTVITYTYYLTNTGNVSLTSPYTIDDNRVSNSNITCSTVSPLKPGDPAVTCSGTYTITASDNDKSTFVNTATATAIAGTMTGSPLVTSAIASATVYTGPLQLAVTPSTSSVSAVNEVITYTYTIANNSGGNITVEDMIDNKATVDTGACENVDLANGGSYSCTGTYQVTTADYNLGANIVSDAKTIVITSGGQTLTSATMTTSVAVSQTQALSMALVSVTPSQPVAPAASITEGTTITYVYSLTNTGNVTLTSPFTINDGATTNCASITSLAPGVPANCTVTYLVSAADVSAGSFIKTATASGMFGATTVTSASVSTQVLTFSGSRFSIALSGSPNPMTQVGDITYTYTITNTGGTNLTSPYTIVASGTGSTAVSCASASLTLAPGASTTCTSVKTINAPGSYTVDVTSATISGVSATTPLPSVTVPAYICSITTLRFMGPAVVNNSARTSTWTIANDVGMDLHITSIEFVWDNISPAKNLTSMTLAGALVSGSGISYPYTGPSAQFNGSWTLTQGNFDLIMYFSKSGMNVNSLKIYFNESGCGPLSDL